MGAPLFAFCAKGGRDAACSADFDIAQIRYFQQHHTRPCQQRNDGAPTVPPELRSMRPPASAECLGFGWESSPLSPSSYFSLSDCSKAGPFLPLLLGAIVNLCILAAVVRVGRPTAKKSAVKPGDGSVGTDGPGRHRLFQNLAGAPTHDRTLKLTVPQP